MVCEVFRGQVFDGKEFHQKPVLSDEEAAKRPPVRVDPREKIQWNMVYDDTQKNVKFVNQEINSAQSGDFVIFCAIFALLFGDFNALFCTTKVSEIFDIAKPQATYCCS